MDLASLDKMKVVDLRNELQTRGLDTKGVKAVLIERLRAHLEGGSGGVPPSPGTPGRRSRRTRSMTRSPSPSPVKKAPEHTLETLEEESNPSNAVVEEEEENDEKLTTPEKLKEKSPQTTPKAENKNISRNEENLGSAEKVKEQDESEEQTNGREVAVAISNDADTPNCVSENTEPVKIIEKDVQENKSLREETNHLGDVAKPEVHEVESKLASPKKSNSLRERSRSQSDDYGKRRNRSHSDSRSRSRSRSRTSRHKSKSHSRSRTRSRSPKRRSGAGSLGSPSKEGEDTNTPEDEPTLEENQFGLSWFDSDLHLRIDPVTFTSAKPMSHDIYALVWSGARTNYGVCEGKVCFEVRISEEINLNRDHPFRNEPYTKGFRVGFSMITSNLLLGESDNSFAYCESGRKATNGEFVEFGKPFQLDDVIGCYLDLESEPCTIKYTLNGEDLGVAFEFDKTILGENQALFPHVLTKGYEYEINLADNDNLLVNVERKVRKRRKVKKIEEKKEENEKQDERNSKIIDEEKNAEESKEEINEEVKNKEQLKENYKSQEQNDEEIAKPEENNENEEKVVKQEDIEMSEIPQKDQESDEKNVTGQDQDDSKTTAEGKQENKESTEDKHKNEDSVQDEQKNEDLPEEKQINEKPSEDKQKNGDSGVTKAVDKEYIQKDNDGKKSSTKNKDDYGPSPSKRQKIETTEEEDEYEEIHPEPREHMSLLQEYELIALIPEEKYIPGPQRPESRKDCEVILMVGLPGAGKTTWVLNHIKENPDKRYHVIGADALIAKMTIDGAPRKSVHKGRFDRIYELCFNVLTSLEDIAVKRRRNFILDQANAYASAQRRKMKGFGDFKRIAVVCIPNEEELKRRLADKKEKGHAYTLKESTLNTLQAAFTLPSLEFGWFDDIIFTDLGMDEAIEEVKKYNEKGKKALDENHSNRDKRQRRDNYRNDNRHRQDDRRRFDNRNDNRWNDRRAGGGGGGGYNHGGGGNRWGGGGGYRNNSGGYRDDRGYGGGGGGRGYDHRQQRFVSGPQNWVQNNRQRYDDRSNRYSSGGSGRYDSYGSGSRDNRSGAGGDHRDHRDRNRTGSGGGGGSGGGSSNRRDDHRSGGSSNQRDFRHGHRDTREDSRGGSSATSATATSSKYKSSSVASGNNGGYDKYNKNQPQANNWSQYQQHEAGAVGQQQQYWNYDMQGYGNQQQWQSMDPQQQQQWMSWWQQQGSAQQAAGGGTSDPNQYWSQYSYSTPTDATKK